MQIRRAEALQSRNTLDIPASAAAFVEVGLAQEINDALRWARAEGLAALALGEGSNVVFCGDVEALFIQQVSTGWENLGLRGSAVDLRVAAATNWHALVESTLAQGWYGLENLALIPGQVGAAPVQNIGAYGVELAQFIRCVHAVDSQTGASLQLSAQECQFGYRDSVFKRELRDRVIITAVDLRLSTRPCGNYTYPALAAELQRREIAEPAPLDVFNAVVAVRRSRLPDPAREPNAGSFFKNPVIEANQAAALAAQHRDMPQYPQDDGHRKIPAAWLIEQAGWKGQREGAFGIHPQHALVMVNYAGGSGAALLQLAAKVVQSVEEQFGITLEMEPRVYGHP